MVQCQGPALKWQDFFGLYLYLVRRFCKNLQSTRGPTQCKSGPVNNMVSMRNNLLHHFLITIYLHLASFLRDNILLKKKLAGQSVPFKIPIKSTNQSINNSKQCVLLR